jgi:hypothetical protein
MAYGDTETIKKYTVKVMTPKNGFVSDIVEIVVLSKDEDMAIRFAEHTAKQLSSFSGENRYEIIKIDTTI